MYCLHSKFDIIIIKRTCKCADLGGELLRIAALFLCCTMCKSLPVAVGLFFLEDHNCAQKHMILL